MKMFLGGVLLTVLALVGCAPTEDVAQTPTPSATVETSPPTATPSPTPAIADPALYASPSAEGVEFLSEDDNLHCGILSQSNGVRYWCITREHTFEDLPDTQPECLGAFTADLANIPGPQCLTDYQRPAGRLALPANTTLSTLGATCLGGLDTITCRSDSADHGFTISRDAFDRW